MKKILLTGSTGYIGKRLLPKLIQKNYFVICGVRDINRFQLQDYMQVHVEVIELNLLKVETFKNIPKDIDGAYYLVHSMSQSYDYFQMELDSAMNFKRYIQETSCEHVIYLTGIANEDELSEHLNSRLAVEKVLKNGKYNFTALRAGIIIGSGSASFEIIRDLVEKLPVLITPKWLNTKCQPIGIASVLQILTLTLFNSKTYNKNFDIGGSDILTYKEMLLGLAKVRGLKRYIYTLPVMTPKLSSYWLYFVTSTSYKLATALVHSMKVEVICRDINILSLLGLEPEDYETSLKKAFSKIKDNMVASSWKDSFSSSDLNVMLPEMVKAPEFGCFVDVRTEPLKERHTTLNKIWSIGGEMGYYYGNVLWKIRGALDKLFGGVGLRRGRTSIDKINAGDALDFWRVLYANKEEGRLLLYAEMKLPGEAWLEFKIKDDKVFQTATFRPKGLWGRLYWFAFIPIHNLIFKNMLKELVR